MKKLLLSVITLVAFSSFAQTPIEIQVWENGAPNTNGITRAELHGEGGRVGDVTNPVLYVYPADHSKNSGAAIVICPGGGYARLAMNHEGHDMAKWFSANGITAAVLKYRMPNGHHDVPLSDAKQAMRIMKSRAAEWGVISSKIGVAGSSAGGHLASTLATHFDEGTRPDFAILFYPVVSFDDKITHQGSKINLIGKDAKAEIVDLYSNEKQVTAQTPTTLLLLSDDDKTVPSQNSVRFYNKLKECGVPATMYIFPMGGHGWGFNTNFPYHHAWKDLTLKWMRLIN